MIDRGRRSQRLVQLLAATALLAGWASTTAAQADSVTVIAGPRYAAGGLQRFLLGSGYRDLWLTPIRVPVLRPDTFRGGVTVLQRGNSLETLSLRFRAPDGRQYVFRSVDKEQAAGLPRDLLNTLTSDIVQDLVAAKHPGAAMVVAPLQKAAGILHAPPRLAVMADHPLLGEHRETFAGMLGMMEERPDDVEGEPAFDCYPKVIGSERLLERLAESAEDRVDSRAYLAARLVDVLVGDWDRHPDQFRWAEDERDDVRFWLPIPRDRDNAFIHLDGILPSIGGSFTPIVLRFRERYSNLYGLLYNAQPIDRPVLAELPRAVWDSVAAELRRRLTDDVITAAVARLPAAWQPLDAEQLARKLRARRDTLPEIARKLYGTMSWEVDVYGTDEPDHATIERNADGSLRVRLLSPGRDGMVFFDRLFLPAETREVRIHLRGSGDHAVVRGAGSDIFVRVVGGGGDDVLEDFTERGAGVVTGLYDSRGDNRFRTGSATTVDRHDYEPPDIRSPLQRNPPPPRDWGSSRSMFSPEARWPSEFGPIAGGGPTWTRHGFRRIPYAHNARISALVAPFTGRFGVEADARVLHTGGRSETLLAARATQLALTNFHGYGNETPRLGNPDVRRVFATELGASAGLARNIGSSVRLTFGPRVELVWPDPSPLSPADGIPGADDFGVAGARAEAMLDHRDATAFPRSGVLLHGYLTGYPVVWGDAPEAFATGGATFSGYFPLPAPLETTVALRAGAQRVWGESPFQYAPAVGGTATLRGYRYQRFTGDAAVFGNAELRTKLGRANLLVARGDFGALALGDAGRVFVSGESSTRWHAAAGGGFWFAPLDRKVAAHVVYAYGERHTFSAGIGMPF